MTLTRVKLERFAAFEALDLRLSPGVNVLIGENGTGKTQILKVAYAACDVSQTGGSFASKLIRVFHPYESQVGRLVFRNGKSSRAAVEIHRGSLKLRSSFSNHSKEAASATIRGKAAWAEAPVKSAYIPVKEMLSNAPGFRSLYAGREIEFEEIYADILDRAFRPVLRGPQEAHRKRLLHIIQRAIEGKVISKGETFFLKNGQGELEFMLLAEGMRKLALLWLLIQNGTLLGGSVLFWDEPEANLNPKKMGSLVEILLSLQRIGVQVVLATHDYVLMKELHLQCTDEDAVVYHSLYRDEAGVVRAESTSEFLGIHPNAIADTFAGLYDREVRRSLKV